MTTLQVKIQAEARTKEIEAQERTKQLAHCDSILTKLANASTADKTVMQMLLLKMLGGEVPQETVGKPPLSPMPNASQTKFLESMGKQPPKTVSKQNNDQRRHCYTAPVYIMSTE